MSPAQLDNIGHPNAAFFTPKHPVPSGATLAPPDSTPALFKPLTIRSVTFPNRIFCSPMCTYSSASGSLTPWHVVHLGTIAQRGAGLTMIEATAVSPNGRISPEDSGLWSDEQIPGVRAVVDYVHSQGKLVGIQLAHAGRKASTVAPWLAREAGRSVVLAGSEVGGWPDDVVAPTAERWSAAHPVPRALTTEELERVVKGFGDAAGRAVRAGVDVVEVHFAHGYLGHEMLSGVTNKRGDRYGGSFENRMTFLREVVQTVRGAIPRDTPLFVRISATDWLDLEEFPDAWTEEQTIELAKGLHEQGVDLLDVSSGGNHEAQKIAMHTSYQIDIAGRIRRALDEAGGEAKKLLVGAVGGITNGVTANRIVETGVADVTFAARAFLTDPGFALACAEDVGAKVQWPVQYLRRAARRAGET